MQPYHDAAQYQPCALICGNKVHMQMWIYHAYRHALKKPPVKKTVDRIHHIFDRLVSGEPRARAFLGLRTVLPGTCTGRTCKFCARLTDACGELPHLYDW